MSPRMVAVLLALIVGVGSSELGGQDVRRQKGQIRGPDLVRKIVKTHEKVEAALDELFRGPPPQVDLKEWQRNVWVRLYRSLAEFEWTFIDGPCPEAFVEIFLDLKKRGWSPDMAEEYTVWTFRCKHIRVSFLDALDSADPRLSDMLPELRKSFTPLLPHDRDFLRRFADEGKPLPNWYLDRAFTSHWAFNPRGLRDEARSYYGLASTMAITISELYKEDVDLIRDPSFQLERDWSIHVIEGYGLRRKYGRVGQEDVKLARKQLKWLWETKRWWARRYVIEILNVTPELAFDGIIEEIEKERHPNVAPRVTDLKLVEKLKEQRKGNN